MVNVDKKIREMSTVVLLCDKNENEIDCKFVKSDLNVFIMIVIYLFYDFGVIVFPYCGKFSQFQNMKLMTKC